MPVSRSLSTRAIHVGQEPDATHGDIVPPLHLATTFVMDRVGVTRSGYDYGRGTNPTRDAFQQTFASLEDGEAAVAFPSGLSAEDTLIRAVTAPGDHIIFGGDVYGGTYRLLTDVAPAEGRHTTAVDLGDLERLPGVLADTQPKILWVETPSNPLLEVYDLAALADIAHTARALLVVDNTFASPSIQRPLVWGADVVIHSTTKYIGGHSDVLGGVVVVAHGLALPQGQLGLSGTGKVVDEVRYWQNAVGAAPSPRDVHLLSRGLKTLEIRVERQSESALTIAKYLEQHPGVVAVHYPGLPSHPDHDLASKQMRWGGAIVSFEVGSEAQARQVCEGTSLFGLAVSLGAVESLIEHPATMTHGTKAGSATEISPALVRLSVGLEDAADLLDDLGRSLAAASR